MLFLANVHEKRQKRRRAETATEGFDHRRAVEPETAEVEPLDERVTEVRSTLEQAEKPDGVKNPVARYEGAARECADSAKNDSERRREQADLKHQVFLHWPDRFAVVDPKRFHHRPDGELAKLVRQDKQYQRNYIPGASPASEAFEPMLARCLWQRYSRNR